MRKPEQWQQIFRDHQCSSRQLAASILADLRGYRKNSLDRSDDTDNLAQALDAVFCAGMEKAESSKLPIDCTDAEAVAAGLAALRASATP